MAQNDAGPSSWDGASCWSRMFFNFVSPMMAKGSQQTLEHSDLERTPAKEQAYMLVEKLQQEWEEELKMPSPSLWRALYRFASAEYWESGFYCFAESFTRITQPVLLGYLLRWLTQNSAFRSNATTRDVFEGLGWALALSLISFLQIVVHHRLYYLTMQNGCKARIAISGVINQKLLNLNAANLLETSSGKLINLVSNDVMRFDMFYPRIHFGWSAPLDIVVLTVLVYLRVGAMPTLASLVFMFMMLPCLMLTGKKVGDFRKLTAKWTDKRMKTTGEIFAGIMSVKAYCWELPFEKQISGLRANERSTIMLAMTMRAINHALSFATPIMCIVIIFLVFWAAGNTLTIETVFSTMALIHVLTVSIGKNLGNFFDSYYQFKISVARIRTFLLMGEVTNQAQTLRREVELSDADQEKAETTMIQLRGASFQWSVDHTDGEGACALTCLSFEARGKDLVVVHGPTGSGKSALLQALLGELALTSGEASVQTRKIGYAAQKPWILAGTIRSNIIWGNEELGFCQAWYDQVVDACALADDIEQFPYGDATEIGEKGVNLSGGQKARVGLARAVYSKASVYLLDDPLAACDPKVAKEIFQKCICGLLKDATVLLVTHDLNIARFDADKFIRLADGKISSIRVKESSLDLDMAEPQVAMVAKELVATPLVKSAVMLVPEEERVKGVVANNTFLQYIQAGGIWRVVTVAILLVAAQALSLSAEFVLKTVTEQDGKVQQQGSFLPLFVALVLASVFLGLLRGFAFFHVSLLASTQLHNQAFRSVLQSPLTFFVKNPLGRILNKFSSDLGQADETLPVILFQCLETLLLCVGSVVLSIIAVPLVLIILLPIFVYLAKLRQYFVSTSRELMRVDALSKSPVYVSFATTVSGLLTVRAFGKIDVRQEKFVALLSENFKAWYAWLLANRWVGTRLDITSFVVLFSVCVLGVLLADSIDPGMLGFAITYCIQLSGIFQYMIRLSAKVESQMTSVERMLFYANLPSEEEVECFPPDKCFQMVQNDLKSWPSQGSLEFKEVSARYRQDSPDVLKRISFSVPGGSKVGVVGRTGSGKSTLTLALCRLNMLSHGSILIDGIDCSSMSMQKLRENLSFVPQEAVMFAGTLRFNIDPFQKSTDTQLWGALKSVHLFDFVMAQPEKLEMPVHEGGGNLSMGQRQCISLARAILHSGKIYVMDEATASIDTETDSLIQRLVRDENGKFSDCTIITIAHRLETIMDSDLILVLDDGHLVEQGSPESLLSKTDGVFKSLAEHRILKKGENRK
jgi:ATP-binding cassette, subfamily C (CFTR/MRP), member 4